MSGPNPCKNCGLSECVNAPPGAEAKLVKLLAAAKTALEAMNVAGDPRREWSGSKYLGVKDGLRSAIAFSEGRP